MTPPRLQPVWTPEQKLHPSTNSRATRRGSEAGDPTSQGREWRAQRSARSPCGRRLCGSRLAADTREETGQGQGEALPGAGASGRRELNCPS